MSLEVLPIKILPDSKRVIAQYFKLMPERAIRIIEKINSLSEEESGKQLEGIISQFKSRHKNFDDIVMSNFAKVKGFIADPDSLTLEKKMLIGSYFTKEYSIEAASIFNPSMVVHPDQTGMQKNELRFVMSLRATGEGHLSSIEFREGIIKDDNVVLPGISKYCVLSQRIKVNTFKKSHFKTRVKLKTELFENLTKDLNEEFSLEELKTLKEKKIAAGEKTGLFNEMLDIIDSNYELEFDNGSSLDERVIFPSSKSEMVGMEDVRLVKFRNDDGSFSFYGTYTAYNGKTFRVQLLETDDFRKFKIRTLHGRQIKDKGMALFPRKINGKYVMTSRNDGENLFILRSDDLYSWHEKQILYQPVNSFEFVQVGNCGSPIETEYGWLLITHAVGYFRTYSISALLLDINDPGKIIGSLNEPLIEPIETEREGYVPNVVYSCGSVVHGEYLFIPFAMADSSCGFARIKVDELIKRMRKIF